MSADITCDAGNQGGLATLGAGYRQQLNLDADPRMPQPAPLLTWRFSRAIRSRRWT
jgi:hypothetical protein